MTDVSESSTSSLPASTHASSHKSPCPVPNALNKNVKRKREVACDDESVSERLAGRKKSKKGDHKNVEIFVPNANPSSSVGNMDSRLLADFFAQKVKRFTHKLSLVELDDLYISGNLKIKI